MNQFCVNKNAQAGGEHEVHNVTSLCPYLPDPLNRLDLGMHQNCSTAVSKAKRTYPNSDGCYYCARACHTR